jgi:RHS repeat-associated protein
MRNEEWGVHPIKRRYMDPSTGRFTSLDAYAGDPTDPLSYNKYLYTQADPVNGYDPTGNDDFSIDVGSPAVGLLAEGPWLELRAWIPALGNASLTGGNVHEFEVSGYDCKMEWAEGWEAYFPFTGLRSGPWGQPYLDQDGNAHVGPTYVSTRVTIWGHDSCNTIAKTYLGNDGGTIQASVNLSPGKYRVTWGYRVEASCATKSPGGVYSVGDWKGNYVTTASDGKPGNARFGPGPPVKKQDMLTSVVTVTEGGWTKVARYVPQINISGLRDYDRSTETTIEGTLYIYGITKLP